jgi:hypothetical protein
VEPVITKKVVSEKYDFYKSMSGSYFKEMAGKFVRDIHAEIADESGNQRE